MKGFDLIRSNERCTNKKIKVEEKKDNEEEDKSRMI